MRAAMCQSGEDLGAPSAMGGETEEKGGWREAGAGGRGRQEEGRHGGQEDGAESGERVEEGEGERTSG